MSAVFAGVSFSFRVLVRRSLVSSLVLTSALGESLLAQAPARPKNGPQPARRTPRIGLIQGSEVAVVATDEGIDAPEQVDAGLLNLRLFNRSREQHNLMLLRVERLETPASIAEYILANDWNVSWWTPLGGPEATTPWGVSSAIVFADPGRYMLVDLAAAARRRPVDSWIRVLAVTSPPGPLRPVALPPTEISVGMNEYLFDVSAPLYAGRRTLRVENRGKVNHHMAFVRLQPGVTALQAAKWFETRSGPAPFEAMGGLAVMAPERRANVTLDLLPGEYAIVCVLLNPLSQRTHASHGMLRQITVTR